MNEGQTRKSFAPVTLTGRHVVLEPLTMAHHDGLAAAGADTVISRWFPKPVHGEGAMRAFIEEGAQMQAEGKSLPFAIRTLKDGALVGSTRFAHYEAAHLRVEIGWTWINPSVQRSAVNTECKYLLLGHAFEALGLNRVELKTDSLNTRSRAAIARIGGVEEGTFRQHMVVQGGRLRDTVYFSIIRPEWAAVKAKLEGFLV